MHRFVRHVAVLVGLGVAIGCGSSGGSNSTAPTNTGGTGTTNPGGTTTLSTTNSITVGDDFFSPDTTSVPVGTTITWSFSAGSGVQHNVYFGDGTHSNDMSSGTYTKTFSTAGTFAYQCTIHAMNAAIIVH